MPKISAGEIQKIYKSLMVVHSNNTNTRAMLLENLKTFIKELGNYKIWVRILVSCIKLLYIVNKISVFGTTDDHDQCNLTLF